LPEGQEREASWGRVYVTAVVPDSAHGMNSRVEQDGALTLDLEDQL